jgi:hypothetical protein
MSGSREEFRDRFRGGSGPVPASVPAIGNQTAIFDPPREPVPVSVPVGSGPVPVRTSAVPPSSAVVSGSPPEGGTGNPKAGSGAAELLERTRALGIEVWAEGRQIRLRPMGLVPPALLAALRAAKGDVLAALGVVPAFAQEDACSECGRYDWRLSLVDEAGNRACYDCLTGATAMRRHGVPF